ncbi:MAG: DegT/DnrJ/EryC1/StrS family aminotransferase [Rubrobacteridae bacterium]|nr:DegT/DnrJ/EryC1/StrS family aminotransferase [Rubrobacteridae bacterium]
MRNTRTGKVSRCLDHNAFIVFGSPAIEEEEIDEVVSCMRSGWLGTGPRVAKFEHAFAEYKGVESSVAVSSCTAALHLSILAAGIGPGDEVITTPMTFCATINSIIHAGAVPVLADIDQKTMNIDPDSVEEKISDKTKAILPVHFAGRPCEMDRLCALAKRYDLKIIEDCAHAIEAEFKGKKAGTFGDFGCFSFYSTKNVVAGEGGMLLARRRKDAKRVRILALHGLSDGAWARFGDEGFKHYDVIDCGYKYNMMDIQAAIAIHQLARVDSNCARRRIIWNRYQAAFSRLPVKLMPEPGPEIRHAYHLYIFHIDRKCSGINRDRFIEEMTTRGVGVGVHYRSIPEHHDYRKRFGWRTEDFPNALLAGRQTVSLPLSPNLTDEEVSVVIACVEEILSENC